MINNFKSSFFGLLILLILSLITFFIWFDKWSLKGTEEEWRFNFTFIAFLLMFSLFNVGTFIVAIVYYLKKKKLI